MNEKEWKILEQVSINDRTLLVWINPNDSIISMMLGHISERPNVLSLKSPYTTWGYITHIVSNISSTKEAAEVAGFYLKDLEQENYWWENN